MAWPGAKEVMDRSKLDVVLRGAGARGVALNGALTGFESAGYNIGRVIGISGGAIAATLHAVGYGGRDLERLSLEQTPQRQLRMLEFIKDPYVQHTLHKENYTFRSFLEYILENITQTGLKTLPGESHFYSLAERGGLFSAEKLVRWLIEKLESKGAGLSQLSFKRLYEKTGKHLSLIVTDATDRVMRVLNHHTTPDCPVVFGVRMSMNLPMIWPEILWEKGWGLYLDRDISGNIIEDGCLSSGLPFYLFTSDDKKTECLMGARADSMSHVVGVYVDDKLMVEHAPTRTEIISKSIPIRTIERIERQLHLALEWPQLYKELDHKTHICPIPSRGYGVLEFNMSPERIEAVMAAAKKVANNLSCQLAYTPEVRIRKSLQRPVGIDCVVGPSEVRL